MQRHALPPTQYSGAVSPHFHVRKNSREPWDPTATRNHHLSLSLFGLFLLRLAQRTLLSVLFHPPPRNVSAGPYNKGLVRRKRLRSQLLPR